MIANLRTDSKSHALHQLDQVQRYSDDSFYAFTRGSAVFVALTNGGSGQGQIMRTISYHPFPEGTKLCNMYDVIYLWLMFRHLMGI